MAAKTYNIKAVTAILGSFPLGGGYGEDGGLEFEWDADLFEVTVGADGETAYSRTNNDNVTLTITVMESSRAYKDLATLMQAQLLLVDNGAPIAPLNFSMYDPINGDSCASQYAVFLNRPAPSKSGTIGEREFRISLNNAAALFGTKNIV